MRILFVCTGNTCRSSMAAALFANILREQGRGAEQLEIRSAGLAADNGAPASRFAVEALREINIDLTEHKAARVNAELVQWADLILTMTARHKEQLVSAYPDAKGKIHVLKQYLTNESDRKEQERALFTLHQRMAEKRDQFADRKQPNIVQLNHRRNELLQELQSVEQLIALRQAELLEELRPEREAVEKIERSRLNVDVLDPFGQPLQVYRDCREELQQSLRHLAKRLDLNK